MGNPIIDSFVPPSIAERKRKKFLKALRKAKREGDKARVWWLVNQIENLEGIIPKHELPLQCGPPGHPDIQHPPTYTEHLAIGDGGGWTPTVEFNHAEIDRRLGLTDVADQIEAARKGGFEDASETLHRLVAWFAESGALSSAGSKAMALVLAVRPELLAGASQTAMAKKLGVTKQCLSKRVTELYHLGNEIYSSPLMSSRDRRNQPGRKANKAHHHPLTMPRPRPARKRRP